MECSLGAFAPPPASSIFDVAPSCPSEPRPAVVHQSTASQDALPDAGLDTGCSSHGYGAKPDTVADTPMLLQSPQASGNSADSFIEDFPASGGHDMWGDPGEDSCLLLEYSKANNV